MNIDQGSARRSAILVTGAVLITGIVTLWALPYWSVAGLVNAASKGDSERVAQYVATRPVAASLQGQTAVAVRTQAEQARAEGADLAAMADLGPRSERLAAGLADAATITDLVRTHLIARPSRLATAWNLARSHDARWVSMGRFEATAPGDYRFAWERADTTWKLVDVSYPHHVLESAAIVGERPVVPRDVQVFAHPNQTDRLATDR